MSMPTIEASTTERSQAITDIIESVALQQTALSHILNAEGEKLQAVIQMTDITAEELLQTNDSVRKMVDTITRLEMILQSKLALFDTVLTEDSP